MQRTSTNQMRKKREREKIFFSVFWLRHRIYDILFFNFIFVRFELSVRVEAYFYFHAAYRILYGFRTEMLSGLPVRPVHVCCCLCRTWCVWCFFFTIFKFLLLPGTNVGRSYFHNGIRQDACFVPDFVLTNSNLLKNNTIAFGPL